MNRQNVIAYYRVSTLIQDTGRQKKEVKAFCKRMNFNIVQEIEENISGMKSWKERKINSVFNLDNIDGIVVLELSRFGRDAGDVLTAIKELHQNKIWLFSINNNLKTLDDNGDENINGKLLLTILSGVAEMERNVITQRSVSGLIKKVSDGNWTGGKFIPYGYKRVNKRLEIDENESLVIKDIFRLYLSGYGTKRIANILNNKKVPTRYNLVVNDKVKQAIKWKTNADEVKYKDGKDFVWRDGTIYTILTNKVYIGEKDGKGKLKGVRLYSPPIISNDDFVKVQESLKTTQKRVSKKYIYVLEGKPKCGVCENGYFPHKRADNKDNTYKCLSKRYGKSCSNFGIGIPKLNAGVWTALKYNQRELDNILEINNNKLEFENEIKSLEEKNKIITEELNDLLKYQKNIVQLFLENKIEKDILYSKDNEIKLKIENLQLELKKLESELVSKRDFLKNQLRAKNLLRTIKDDVNILKKNFKRVINKIVIYPVLENKVVDVFKTKSDKLVYIELFTFISSIPICFVISQRSKKFLLVDEYINFDKENKILTELIDEEVEEEEFNLTYIDLIILKNLNEVIEIKKNVIQS